jgi:WD40 repeat protein
MTAPVLSSKIPSGVIDGLALVTVDGRLLLCAGDGIGAYTWEPSEDRWTKYRLDLPYRPADFRAMVGYLPTEDDHGYRLHSVCAAAVDGRIVVGGGNYEEPFAQWDLASGAVRAHARLDDGGTGKTTTVWLNGRPFFISCDASTYMRDVERTDAEPVLLPGYLHRDTVAGIAAGTLNGRPVVVFGDKYEDRVVVWDVDTRSVLREFPCPVPVQDVGLTTLDGRAWMVIAGVNRLVLGAPGTGAWEWDGPIDEDSIEFDEENEEAEETENSISCMDVGVVGGRPAAVTGSQDGRVYVWSLEERRPIQGPFIPEHEGGVNAVRIADLDGHTVAVTAGQDQRVLVWDLEQN